MKASVAFAIGLWTGGLIVAGVWLFHHRQSVPPATPGSGAAIDAAALADDCDAIARDNARLIAEAARLRETLEELYADAETAVAAPVPAPEPAPAPAPVREIPAAAPSAALLEEQAYANTPVAIESLVLATDQSYQALLRLLRSEQLDDKNRAAIESYVAGILEQYLAETEAREASPPDR